VVVLGVRLGIACSSIETLELQLQSTLEVAEQEKADFEKEISFQEGEVARLELLLACHVPPELAIEKLVRRGEHAPWLDTTRAAPGDLVQFRVVLRGAARNVYLRDILPIGFGEIGNLRVDGELIQGDISQLYLSNIVGEIEITYTAQLSWSLGEVTLTNQVSVWADCLEEQLSQATVEVKPRPASAPSSGSSGRPRYDNNKSGGPGPEAP